ncbi:antitoxin ParD1/3/4 [Hephaestia caeni]|uniref:Antitoxin ParD1/3/4 n=1 Tax=Hephaestia caeni TaxID=645617 RepID=A0A397NJ56_9SPHN|nr:type II toxin-antitoxin system ParD family antitoxin [Hephaestia caeni]RIA35543.1 antitoxin ParD1/3/4 [Hephaestia caeni]
MGAVRKLSIALTEELASEVDNAVATGDYASASEVIRDALRLWRRDRDADRAETLRLRRLWEEGLASGKPQDVTDEWFEDIKRRGMARLAALREAG